MSKKKSSNKKSNDSILRNLHLSLIMGCSYCKTSTNEPIVNFCGHTSCIQCFQKLKQSDSICTICQIPILGDKSYGRGLHCMWLANQSKEFNEILRLSQLGVEFFNQALQKDPNLPTIQSYLGQCLMLSGNFKKAVEHLNIAIEQDSTDANANYLLARILKSSDYLEEAMSHANMAIIAAEKRGFDKNDIPCKDYEKLVNELKSMIENRGMKLRFNIGDRVECKTNHGWREGRVIRLYYLEDHFEKGFIAPYQILLIDKCVCYGICGCDDRYIYAPIDRDYCIRAIIPHRPASSIYYKGSYCSFESLSSDFLSKELPKLIDPKVWKTIESDLDFYINLFHRRFAQRRRIFPNEDKTVRSYILGLAVFFGKDSLQELQRRVKQEDDVQAMIDLADFYLFYSRKYDTVCDIHVAKELLLKASDRNHPEAYTALAILHYHKLFPKVSNEELDYNTEIPKILCKSTDYKEMWKYLEMAADVDYVSPFLLIRLYEAHRKSSWSISNTLRSIMEYREDELEKQKEIELEKERQQHMNKLYKCSNSRCSVQTTDCNELKLCARCLSPTVMYCSKECQRIHWPYHKRVCTNLSTSTTTSTTTSTSASIIISRTPTSIFSKDSFTNHVYPCSPYVKLLDENEEEKNDEDDNDEDEDGDDKENTKDVEEISLPTMESTISPPTSHIMSSTQSSSSISTPMTAKVSSSSPSSSSSSSSSSRRPRFSHENVVTEASPSSPERVQNPSSVVNDQTTKPLVNALKFSYHESKSNSTSASSSSSSSINSKIPLNAGNIPPDMMKYFHGMIKSIKQQQSQAKADVFNNNSNSNSSSNNKVNATSISEQP